MGEQPQKYKLTDYVAITNRGGTRRVNTPTLGKCSACGGYSGFYGRKYDPQGEIVPDSSHNHTGRAAALFACKIALIHWGMGAGKYDNPIEDVHPCICDEILAANPWPCAIKSDSGWELNVNKGNPTRGHRYFDRSLTFERALTPAEVETVKKRLRHDNCPGWLGMTFGHDGARYWFQVEHDSSD